jgi:hypothetical protein
VCEPLRDRQDGGPGTKHGQVRHDGSWSLGDALLAMKVADLARNDELRRMATLAWGGMAHNPPLLDRPYSLTSRGE